MSVLRLCTAPPPDLARALAEFEAQFTYPLGPGRFFRISHGEDYPRFFRAMGEAACFIAQRQGQVVATICAAIRRLVLPNGQEQSAVYLGDLKVLPSARGGRLLPRLVQAVRQWAGPDCNAGFSVVMDGTSATPERYTGRVGIPLFRELGKIAVLRLPTAAAQAAGNSALSGHVVTPQQGEACYVRFSGYAVLGGDPAERSEMEPRWLIHRNLEACGRLEDTRKAKRLFADNGEELRSVHLSCFAYGYIAAAAELLNYAMRYAAERGFPALFVAVPASAARSICVSLAGKDFVIAPATVYGFGLEPYPVWNINTAEI